METEMKSVVVSVFLVLCASNAVAATQIEKTEAVEIPLKEVWAYQMPGTRDVRDLEPDKFGPQIRKLSSAEQLKKYEKSLTSQVLGQLDFNKLGQKANPGFAVAGIGADALHEAAAVLSEKKKPQTSFPANSYVSVVFFSHQSGYYVHVDKVEQQPGLVVISYQFVPHESRNLTRHFALIPLGKLPPGKVRVDIKRSPMQKKLIDAGFKEADRSDESQVAQSFRFTVNAKGD
jgi:hypothetical protein